MKKFLPPRYIPLALVAFIAGFIIAYEYIQQNINTANSAKPEANRLLSGIQRSQGTIVHTYNRTAGSQMGSLRIPAFEYYVLYDHTPTKDIIHLLSQNLTDLGYDMKTARFVPGISGCTRYEFKPQFKPREEDAAQERERCLQVTGVDSPDLFGVTENDKVPYYTLYATSDAYTIQAQASDKTFSSTANDFWSQEFAENRAIEYGRIPDGKAMLVIEIRQKGRK